MIDGMYISTKEMPPHTNNLALEWSIDPSFAEFSTTFREATPLNNGVFCQQFQQVCTYKTLPVGDFCYYRMGNSKCKGVKIGRASCRERVC
jgi:hypothetical protein